MSLNLKKVSNATALKLLKIIQFCMYFMLIVPIITLLYQDKGVSVGDFFLIQGIFAFTCFFIEIPSGYMSDRFSRKNVMLFGGIFTLVAMVILFYAYGFWQLALAETLLGFSSALFSGTQEAYVYDLLKRLKKEKKFLREYGSVNTWGQMSSFIATILGGTLFAIIGNWVVALQGLAAFVGVVCIMLLPELTEVRRKVAPESSPLKDIAGIVKMAVKHPELKWLMLFPALYGSFTLVLMWGLQPTMQGAGVATTLFGFFVGVNQFSRVLCAKFSNGVYERFGAKKIIIGLCCLLAVAPLLVILTLNVKSMPIVYVLCLFLAFVPATQKMISLVFNTLVHHRIKSQERGTVLSVASMYVTLCNGSMMILMKPMLDGVGLGWAMVLLLCLMVVLFIPFKKVLLMDIK